MRTIDPELWYKKVRKPPLNTARPLRFGFKGLSQYEIQLRKSFCDAMKDFCRNCSVDGVSFIMDKSNPKPLRWCYLIVLVVSMACGLVMMIHNFIWFFNLPRLTLTALPVQRPIQNIDFPAIAICSNNVISLSALNKYARYIHSLDKNRTYSLTSIKQNLLGFGGLHSSGKYEYDFRFANYLRRLIHERNVTSILYKLAPDCTKMLLRCSWHARRVHCDRIFAKRITNLGFCCVFNGRYHPMDRNNPVQKANLVGQDSGLTVVVRENPDDITYLRHVRDGSDVAVFDGWEYPLARAGVLHSVPAARRAAVTVLLRARAEMAADHLQRYSDGWLGCHLRRPGEVGEAGQWSRCVGECRAAAVRALCRCSLHTLSPLTSSTHPHCSLEHLTCLHTHTEKLVTLYPTGDVHESLRAEQANSIDCSHCRNECVRRRYSAAATAVPYDLLRGDFLLNRIFKGIDLTNTSIVNVYYSTKDQDLFLLETTTQWFEVLAYMDSQWVFVVGVTGVSALELLYHCTVRWTRHYKRRSSMFRKGRK